MNSESSKDTRSTVTSSNHGLCVGDSIDVISEKGRLRKLLSRPRQQVVVEVAENEFCTETRRMTWKEWFAALRREVALKLELVRIWDSRFGIGFYELLGFFLVGLKLGGVINWSWWIVTLPFWWWIAVLAVIALVAIVASLFMD